MLYSLRKLSIKSPSMTAPSLVIQTTYAELLERCAATAFADAFPEDGGFISKLINGRRYWYFQATTPLGREQKYVGPETQELLERIAHHKQARDDERERRALVATMVRSFGFPAPIPKVGDIIAELAKAGVFRLRCVLVGTAAYQTYSAVLGIRLPSALLQTTDVDIAQFTSVSITVADRTPPMLQVLQKVESSFKEVPRLSHDQGATSYRAKGGLKVDFLTPNEGPDSDESQTLPALQTEAQQLRFLDFLIVEPAPAVVLHGPGVQVYVPSPERYAVHKLIIARRRSGAEAKSDKDLKQSAALLEILAERRPEELRAAWEEAFERGPTWRSLLLQGMARAEPLARDLTLKILYRAREVIPGMDLTFNAPRVRYDSERDVVTFLGEALGKPVTCSVSRETLEDHFNASSRGTEARIDAFLNNRAEIEALLRIKYLSSPVEEPESVLLKTLEVDELRALGSKHA